MCVFYPWRQGGQSVKAACPGDASPFGEVWLRLGKGLQPKSVGAKIGLGVFLQSQLGVPPIWFEYLAVEKQTM
jgi:hypothetical protein